jgi:hypothetical protein
MTADIIPFSPPSAASAIRPPESVLELVGLNSSEDVQARYEEVLPIAREFVYAWIDHPDAIADFLAWAHARGALKL